MGNPKLKWTAEEEAALLAGIERHGAGKWKTILTDPEFAPVFSKRTNIDLKDKWRNITVSTTGHHGMKEKAKVPKLGSHAGATSSNAQSTDSLAIVQREEPAPLDVVMEDAYIEPKSTAKYSDLILQAVSAAPNGLDAHAIGVFIEKRKEVPSNFKRLLGPKLKKLQTQGKLHKVHDLFFTKKIGTLVLPESKPQSVIAQRDTAMEEASISAAYMVADADNKSYLASEAVNESERVVKMREDSDVLLRIAEEIHKQCSQGHTVILS